MSVFFQFIVLYVVAVACLLVAVADDAKVHRNPTLISMIDLDKYELFKSDGHSQSCVDRNVCSWQCGDMMWCASNSILHVVALATCFLARRVSGIFAASS
jgi:hypothetical protein